MRDRHFKKYIHLKKPFQPYYHYQKIKQSPHSAFLWCSSVGMGPSVFWSRVCHYLPSTQPSSTFANCAGGGESLEGGETLTQGGVQIPAPLRPCHGLPPNILLWSSYSVLKLCPGKSPKFPLCPNRELHQGSHETKPVQNLQKGWGHGDQTKPSQYHLLHGWIFFILFLGSFQ